MSTESALPIPPGVLVHLGAGSCAALEDFLSRYPRVVLVDADARSVDELQRRALSEPRLCVIQAAVASEAGSGFLYQYNLPEATSIHPATGLLELYPGLRLLDKTPIALESVVDVLRSIDMEANAANTIIVDLPGEEFPVLYTLARLGLLVQFQEVYVHGGRIPLYEGALPLPEIAHWLKDEGFDLQEEDDSADPDKPCARFRRNRLSWQNRELESRVSSLLQEAEHLRRDVVQSQQVVAELLVQVEQAGAAKNSAGQLATARQDEIATLYSLKAAAEQLAAERHAAIEQVVQGKAAAEQLAEERLDEIGRLHQVRAAAEQLAAERQAVIEQLTHGKAAAEELAEHRQAEIEQLHHARAGAEQLAAERQAAIEQLAHAKVAAEQLAEERLDEIGRLHQIRAAADQLATERQAVIEQLTHAKAAAEQLATERQAAIEQLSHGKAAADQLAEQRRVELDQLHHARVAADQLAAERQAEIEQLHHARAGAEQLAAERQAAIEQLAHAKVAAEQLAEERLDEIGRLHQIRAAADQLATERQAVIEQLTHAKAAAEQLATDRQTAIEQLSAGKAAADQLAEQRRVELDQLHHARAAAERLAEQRRLEIEQLELSKAEVEELAKQLQGYAEQQDQELKQARQAQSLALKLQLLKEADLKELQERYKKVSTEHQEQRDLLGKLSERLVVAQRYFQELTTSKTTNDERLFDDLKAQDGSIDPDVNNLAPGQLGAKKRRRRQSQ